MLAVYNMLDFFKHFTCNLRRVVIRIQKRTETQGHLFLSWVGTQPMDVCKRFGVYGVLL